MKKISFVYPISICIIFILYACGKEDKTTPTDPTKVNLIFPFENSECTGGTDTTDTHSTILFEWSAGRNTDEYELILTNLNSGDSLSYLTSEVSIPITVERATPFAWYVLSKSNSSLIIAKSETWRFYNAGEAILSYAPFPAEIVSPAMAETINTTASVITLTWIGNDPDDDIVGYDVYFGTTEQAGILENDLSESTLSNVAISLNTVYYWEIITKDARGNSSRSGIYQFRIL